MYWKSVSAKESPNKELVASCFNYNSDGNRHAPYGTYVFLNQAHRSINPTKGHIIFAGYCENNLSLNWQSNTELSIKCKVSKPESLRSLSTFAYGVSIKFESQ